MIGQEIAEINTMIQNQQKYLKQPLTGFEDSAPASPLGSSRPESSSSYTQQRRSDQNSDSRRLYGDIFPHLPSWHPRDQSYGSYSTTPRMDNMISGLPSREQSDLLIWAFIAGYHTMIPTFHGPSFLEQSRGVLEWIATANEDLMPGAHFLALFTAVLFAGCVVCPRAKLRQAFGDVSREVLSSRLYKHAIRAIRLSDFPQSPSLHSLAAFIIVDTTWLREEQPLTCCSFVGVAVRVAQMLGLHKEPSKFPNIPAVEVQVRRQMWWALVAIDTQVAYASGLPPIIESGIYDVQPFSQDINSRAGQGLDSQHSFSNSMLGAFVAGRFDFYRLSSGFLHALHNSLLSRQDVDSICEIVHRIRKAMETRRRQVQIIEQTLQSANMPTGSDEMSTLWRSESNPVLAQFTKMVLSMLAAKPFAVMYGPLKRHNVLAYLKQKEPNHMMYCREFLYRFLRLTQCRDFQPWHWAWPGQHQPLHSIMALISDLEDNPSDRLANRTRKLVDLALYMCGGPDQGNSGIVSNEDGDPDLRPLHEGGSEAWALIRRARQRVWEEAGLDPSVLRCPENVDDIHFDWLPGQFDEDRSLPGDMFHDQVWGPLPQTSGNWSFLANATDHDMNFMSGLDMNLN